MAKILVISTYTYPNFSGSGKNAFNFSRELSKTHPVTLLSFNRNLALACSEIIEGVRISRIPYFPGNFVLKAISLFFILPAYVRALMRHDMVLIYGARIPAFELLILAGSALKKKVVFRSLLLGVDDLESVYGHHRFSKYFKNLIFSRLNLYFSLNPEFSFRFLRNIDKPVEIFESPQGVDLETFHKVSVQDKTEIRKKLHIPEELPVIVTVGFLIQRKGHIEVFEQLLNLDIPYLYYLIGELEYPRGHFLRSHSTETRRIIERGKELLGDKLVLTGRVEEVWKYLNAGDFFILNSRQEGLSNALLEAMACGLCAVVRRIPGLDEKIFRHGKNLVIFEHPSEIPDILTALLKQPEKRTLLGNMAHETISRHASLKKVSRDFLVKLGAE